MDSGGPEDHQRSHTFQPGHQHSATINSSTYPSSSNTYSADSSASPNLSHGDQDAISNATSSTESIPQDAAGEAVAGSENEAVGPSLDAPKLPPQRPSQLSGKLSSHQLSGVRQSDDQRSAARGLKIRISFGQKLAIKKEAAVPVHSPTASREALVNGGTSAAQEPLGGTGLPLHSADAQEVADRDRSAGDSSCTDTDEDGELIQRAMKAKEELLRRQQELRLSKPRQSSSYRPRPGGVTLKLLIDEGLLQPGPAVLNLEYRGLQETGDLLTDGRIQWKDRVFDSPSAFSIFVKRMVNPSRKADDGWKTVKYCGKYLDHYKLELARQRFGPAVVADALGPNNSDTELEHVVKRPRMEPGCPLPNTSVEAGTSGGAESNTPAGSEQVGASFHHVQNAVGVSSPSQTLQHSDPGNDDGLQGSDALIHSRVFPGEASLIHPSLLGI
ncbi:unnamed protein product [Ostreobium quekettii]|uniref:RAMA domain-containing protein n=1 Tax=Ostreobium quekettii TaxID=121088 RepID=A0A8S1ILP8_9CHLO|nr:unnamed protein product [Ostreobium quekettii]|eukprot:evm.model.scf_291.10 EVM.evm.TU.scf_291.10   scf_291:82094-84186(-)